MARVAVRRHGSGGSDSGKSVSLRHRRGGGREFGGGSLGEGGGVGVRGGVWGGGPWVCHRFLAGFPDTGCYRFPMGFPMGGNRGWKIKTNPGPSFWPRTVGFVVFAAKGQSSGPGCGGELGG